MSGVQPTYRRGQRVFIIDRTTTPAKAIPGTVTSILGPESGGIGYSYMVLPDGAQDPRHVYQNDLQLDPRHP
jgi:hypothetical protein